MRPLRLLLAAVLLASCARLPPAELAATTPFGLARTQGRFVAVEGLRVFAITLGQGPDVVLLHGNPASTYSWRKVLEPLAARHRVHAIDLPGYGFSDKPADAPYDPAWFARVVVGYLDAAGVRRAVLVGNSMGGHVATETAILYPERTAGLVLLGAAGLPEAEREGRPLSLRMLTWPVLGPLLRQLPGRGRPGPGRPRAPAGRGTPRRGWGGIPRGGGGGGPRATARPPAEAEDRGRRRGHPRRDQEHDAMPEGMRHQAERHRAGRRTQVEGAVVERLGAPELPGLRQVDGEGVERRVDEALRGAEEEPRRGERRRGADGGEQRDREGEEPERGQDDRPPSERVAEPSRADARQHRGRRVGQEEGRDRSEGRVLHEGGDVGDDGAERHPATGDGRDRRGELRRGPQRHRGVDAGRCVVRQRPGDRQADGREHARGDEERGEAAQPDELLAERRRERVRGESRDAEEAEGGRPAPLGRELRRERRGRVEAGREGEPLQRAQREDRRPDAVDEEEGARRGRHGGDPAERSEAPPEAVEERAHGEHT